MSVECVRRSLTRTISSYIRAVRPVAILLAVCCCLSAVGARWLEPMATSSVERPATASAAAAAKPPASGAPLSVTVGAVDTIGGTTYDWQFSGPSWRMLANSAGHGIYVVWMYSASMSGSTFPDRLMCYNYYDRASHSWVYMDTSFMNRGMNVFFPRRSGYGSIDVDTSGLPFISCHATLGGATRPWVAKGVSGNYSDTTLTTCMWPPIAVGENGAVHILPLTSSYDLTYCRIAPDSWPHWSTPLTGISPSPGFVTQNIAASKVSNKVALVWEVNQSRAAYQMHSTDGGLTWDSTSELVPPDAYGGDTVTGFDITSLFPFYDRHDRLHIVANLSPVLNDTAGVVPSQIWHYCPDNTPQWSRIHIASCNPANMKGSVGENATYACRPTIGQDQYGGLYVAWEQFDSSNVDTTTSRLRGDIFYAQDNGDNGAAWQPSVKITSQGTWSCRFPSAIDYFEDDTFRVSYLVDQQAGFFAGPIPEGSATLNPVVVQKVPVTVGIAEGDGPAAARAEFSAFPNPVERTTTINYQLGTAGSVALTVRDVTGRTVRTLASGFQKPGKYSVTWDSRDNRGQQVARGVYFYCLDMPGFRAVKKAVVTR